MIWAVAALMAVVVMIGVFTAYRQQIKKICCRLTFLSEHKTNMLMTSNLPFPELDCLIDNINEVLELSRRTQRTALQNEDSLKETITNLSHDIRTPLTSLDGYFQLLAQSDSEEERAKYIEIIESRITSLKDMLEELFTYTKLQNENYELPVESLDFGRCTLDTIFSFFDELQKKGIEPHIDFTEEYMPVTANGEAVRRSLQNIIKNALEHGQNNISFELKRVDTHAVFRCRNDVKNTEDIDINQVFSRFYKADAARSSTSTGLGLSIAKDLVEKMNGTISASLESNMFMIEIQFRINTVQHNQMI